MVIAWLRVCLVVVPISILLCTLFNNFQYSPLGDKIKEGLERHNKRVEKNVKKRKEELRKIRDCRVKRDNKKVKGGCKKEKQKNKSAKVGDNDAAKGDE